MAAPPMGSAPTNVYLETAAVGVREDLANIIYRIDPDETPLVGGISRVPASQVLTEWLVQTLNPAIDNSQPEGFTAAMAAVVKPVRLNNVCQIIARTVGVSNTLRVVDVAGGEDEYNRQLILRGLECKRDLEFAATSPLVRTITDPRHMSGLPCYCNNANMGATGGTAPVGDGSNAGTIGTAQDLTLAMVNAMIQACWQAGKAPNLFIMSGNVKAYFSTLAQGGTSNPIVAQTIQAVSPREEITIQGAVDVYRSNFGTHQLAPDRFCPAHQILMVSTDFLELAPLPERDMIQEDYAITGDNSQGGIVFEGCIRPTAPLSHAYIASLNQ